MADPVQSRFERLFPNRPKIEKPTSSGLHFSEQELLDYQESQRKSSATIPSHEQQSQMNGAQAPQEIPTDPKAPVKLPIKQPSSSHSSLPANNLEQGHIPGTCPDQVVYVPTGVWRGGLGATQLEDVEGEVDFQPDITSKPCTGTYCVWSLVAKFPYKYMQDPGSKVSIRFFAAEKIFARNWEVYYVFGPASSSFKRLILVPINQMQTLIDEIRNEFNVNVNIPRFPFQISFFDDGTPQPRYLGTINSKDDMQELQSKIPSVPETHDDLPTNATTEQTQSLENWRERTERALEAEKKKGKSSAKKKQATKRHEITIMESTNQLKRSQRYLGLRPPLPPTQIIRVGDGASVDSTNLMNDASSWSNALDIHKPAPFPFEDNTVMVAIDVEAWERDHSMITEIGVSTLDINTLKNIAPGEDGEDWIKNIRSRHFRIKGREALRNTQFVRR